MLTALLATALIGAIQRPQTPLPSVPPEERQVLMQLFAATGGAQWKRNDGWDTSTPVCSWYGVHCDFLDGDANRAVVSGLSLSGNNLRGSLPATLVELRHLKLLDVARNRLSGDVPEAFLQLWDRHEFEFSGDGNSFSDFVVHASIVSSASGILCGQHDDARFQFEVDAVSGRATFESIRCAGAQTRQTYCLVREGALFAIDRFSRALKPLVSRTWRPKYEYPFSATTHGVYLTTGAVWGDGTKTSVETYDRQGPADVWTAQQLFLGLLSETFWDREFRKPKCSFQQ